MSDAKYFQRGKIQELRAELNSDKKDAKHTKKKVVMKKIVANMTMGNDMSSLFPDVIACMQVPVLEVKKMVYLYLINYARNKPDMALMAVNSFVKDVADPNPLIRALAIRTMGYIHVDKIIDCLCEPLRHCLRDQDPYVRKTAAICVAKLYMHDRVLVENEGFVDMLRELLADSNPTVVANAVAALTEISERSGDIELNLNMTIASKLLTAMAECSEWGQTFILEAIMTIVPQEAGDAELLAERITPRLQHANSAVVLTSIKVIMYLMNYMKDEAIPPLCKKLSPPLVTLLSSGPEVQYVALRNILLIIQKRSDVLSNEMKVFFCKYNDVIYVKLAKLEIMFRLANESNVDQVISELKEYAAEVDVDFVRKSVRCIGRLAVKIERTAERCIAALLDLIQTKVDYVVQEAIVVIKDIFRKYPNKYENIIATLCENLDNLDEPEAKAAMIWIIGQYADRIENSDELLEGFLESFKEEGVEVQLALLTATVKLFIKRPTAGQELVPKVLKWATEETDNPDLRDRGYIYWRLLSTDPQAAKAIVLCEKPLISTEADNMERSLLDGLLLHISSIASIYHKPPTSFLIGSKVRTLKPSAALNSQASTKPLSGAEKNDPSIYENSYINNPYANDVVPMNAAQAVNLLDLDFAGESAIDAVRSTGGFGGEAFGGGMQEQQFLPTAELYGIDLMNANTFGRNLHAEQERSHSPGANSAFGGPPPNQGNNSGSFSPTRPFASTGVGNSSLQGSNLNPSTLYDPMRQLNVGGSVSGASMPAKVRDLYDLNIVQGYVPTKLLLLSAANGKGLEITGTFARRQGRMTMEMTFTNKAMQPLSDFAIQLNKNTYAICPAGLLELRSPLPPNQTAEGILQLKCEGLPQLMQPVNNLQVALKNNVGVFYFQTLIPLHILFSEDGRLERNEYLKLWKEIPATNEHCADITVPQGCSSIDFLKNKLNMNNVFAVADRQVDNHNLLYLSAKLLDRTTYLVELKMNSTLTVCQAAVKTYATHGSAAFLQTISDILSA